MTRRQTMNRRDFLRTTAAAGAVALAAQAHGAPPATDGGGGRPNILLLIGEQHNPRVMGAAGHPVVRTPNMDRLAGEGVYFPNAYSATPLCVPGRVAMLTGRFGHDTGATDNIYEDLVKDSPTLPRALREAGYRTCHVGKTHLATGARLGTPQGRQRYYDIGFDEDFATTGKNGAASDTGRCAYVTYLKQRGVHAKLKEDYERRIANRATALSECSPSVLDVEDYHDQWISRTATHWLQGVPADRPFYLSVNWAGPHALRDAPGRYATMYDPAAVDPPIDDPMEHAPAPVRRRRDDTLAKLPGDSWRGLRASYYGMLSLLDDGIGMMLDVLERRGVLDNTLIVYLADHGEMLCDHGCVYKTMMYEQSAAIPFIVRWPKRFRRGLVSRSTASHVDLAPTLLDAAGAGPLPVMHGHSLVPTLTAGVEHDRPVFCEYRTTRMIRRGQWKYVSDATWDLQQLFDLRADPNELNNLVDEHPTLVADFRRQADAWLARTGAPDAPPTA
ncbi:MAG: sulfatase-like hydrolase/transferase [Planctomycetes bacterium]|nr:sulfatase-like hydrolase/transferase [Planctomycetota bacterium]